MSATSFPPITTADALAEFLREIEINIACANFDGDGLTEGAAEQIEYIVSSVSRSLWATNPRVFWAKLMTDLGADSNETLLAAYPDVMNNSLYKKARLLAKESDPALAMRIEGLEADYEIQKEKQAAEALTRRREEEARKAEEARRKREEEARKAEEARRKKEEEERRKAESDSLTQFRRNAVVQNNVLVKYNGSEEHVEIPAGITTIGAHAFEQNSRLKTVGIPASVTRIEERAFFSCSGLKSIVFPKGLTYIGKYAFTFCYALTNFTLPGTIREIEERAFMGCQSITKVVLPSSMTRISNSMFYNCGNLTDITIPSSITYIDVIAFGGCTNLRRVKVPKNCKLHSPGVFPDTCTVTRY